MFILCYKIDYLLLMKRSTITLFAKCSSMYVKMLSERIYWWWDLGWFWFSFLYFSVSTMIMFYIYTKIKEISVLPFTNKPQAELCEQEKRKRKWPHSTFLTIFTQVLTATPSSENERHLNPSRTTLGDQQEHDQGAGNTAQLQLDPSPSDHAAFQPELPSPPLLQEVHPNHPIHLASRNPDLLREERMPDGKSARTHSHQGKLSPKLQNFKIRDGSRGWKRLLCQLGEVKKAGGTSSPGKHLGIFLDRGSPLHT